MPQMQAAPEEIQSAGGSSGLAEQQADLDQYDESKGYDPTKGFVMAVD